MAVGRVESIALRIAQAPSCCPDREGLAADVEELDIMEAAARHAAVADPTRLRMLALIARSELCGCELEDLLHVSHATVSHHAKRLIGAGLIAADRRGKWVYYQPTDEGSRWAP